MDDQVVSQLGLLVFAAFLAFGEVCAIGFILYLLPRVRFLEDLDDSQALVRETAIVLIVLGLPLGWIVASVTGNYVILFSVLFAIAIVMPQW